MQIIVIELLQKLSRRCRTEFEDASDDPLAGHPPDLTRIRGTNIGRIHKLGSPDPTPPP